jgi:hypothetical protein
MDIVKLVVEDPVLLGVVDEEREVGRDQRRLDRREIRTDNFGGGMKVGEIDGPLAQYVSQMLDIGSTHGV